MTDAPDHLKVSARSNATERPSAWLPLPTGKVKSEHGIDFVPSLHRAMASNPD